MAPTIKWQRWEGVAYDWFGTGATDALPSLEAELDAWIATVNGNASNVGRQVTKERGYADSSSGTYAGLTISCGANNNTEKGYMFYGTHGSTTAKAIYLGSTYADDTSRGGYGTIGSGPSDTSVSWYTSGQPADWLIVYGTVDGEEYFIFGPRFGTSTNYMDGFSIVKGIDGEWSLFTGDGTLLRHIHYFDDSGSTGFSTVSRVTTGADKVTTVSSSTGSYGRFEVLAAATPSPGFIGASSVIAASPDLLRPGTSGGTGDRKVLTDVGSGTDVYLLTAYHYGPTVLVDLRP